MVLEAIAERRAGSSPAWGTIRISLSMFRHGQQAMQVDSMRQFVSPDRRFGKTVIKVYMKPGHDCAVGWHDWGYGQPLRVSTLGARVASLSARSSMRDPEGARARFFRSKIAGESSSKPARGHCRVHVHGDVAERPIAPGCKPGSKRHGGSNPSVPTIQTRARWRGLQQTRTRSLRAYWRAAPVTPSATRTSSLASSQYFSAWMAEWLKAADCKPADESPRQFKSGSMLQ